MSAPRIKIVVDATGHDDVPPLVWFCDAGPIWAAACGGGEAYTIHDAATDGMRHLADHHTAQMPTTPVVQTIVSSTRCTCGDLPRSSYPWFTPCPVHSYLVNTTTAQMPPVAHGDQDGLNVAQNRAPQAPLPYSSPLDRAHNEGSRR